MTRNNTEHNRIYDPMIEMGFKLRPMNQTLAADFAIDRDVSPLLVLDTGGVVRVVTLPAAERGLTFYIVNSSAGAFALTVKNLAAVTIASVAQGKIGFFTSDGTNWYGSAFP